MARLSFEGHTYEAAGEATVLDALLAGGAALPHGCRAGACGACLVVVRAGPIPPGAQAGLPPALVARGCVHACRARPTADLELERPGQGLRVEGEIAACAPLSSSVTRVTVRVPAAFAPARGQYVSIARGGIARDGSARCFSIADRGPGEIVLHVRRVPGGALSPYLCDQAAPGDPVAITGPFGVCVYEGTAPDEPLLLAGTGVGLAPLWGILRDALAAGHRAPIWLLHGAADPTGLYLREELAALAAEHPNLRYRPSVLGGAAGASGAPGAPLEEGPLAASVRRHVHSARGVRAFLCGAPDVVRGLQKQIFLAGAAMKAISADLFLAAGA